MSGEKRAQSEDSLDELRRLRARLDESKAKLEEAEVRREESEAKLEELEARRRPAEQKASEARAEASEARVKPVEDAFAPHLKLSPTTTLLEGLRALRLYPAPRVIAGTKASTSSSTPQNADMSSSILDPDLMPACCGVLETFLPTILETALATISHAVKDDFLKLPLRQYPQPAVLEMVYALHTTGAEFETVEKNVERAASESLFGYFPSRFREFLKEVATPNRLPFVKRSIGDAVSIVPDWTVWTNGVITGLVQVKNKSAFGFEALPQLVSDLPQAQNNHGFLRDIAGNLATGVDIMIAKIYHDGYHIIFAIRIPLKYTKPSSNELTLPPFMLLLSPKLDISTAGIPIGIYGSFLDLRATRTALLSEARDSTEPHMRELRASLLERGLAIADDLEEITVNEDARTPSGGGNEGGINKSREQADHEHDYDSLRLRFLITTKSQGLLCCRIRILSTESAVSSDQDQPLSSLNSIQPRASTSGLTAAFSDITPRSDLSVDSTETRDEEPHPNRKELLVTLELKWRYWSTNSAIWGGKTSPGSNIIMKMSARDGCLHEAQIYTALAHTEPPFTPHFYGCFQEEVDLKNHLIIVEGWGVALRSFTEHQAKQARHLLVRLHDAGFVQNDVAARNFVERDGVLRLIDMADIYAHTCVGDKCEAVELMCKWLVPRIQ